MPCDTRRLSPAEAAERERAYRELEAEIAAGQRALTRNYFGEFSIVGYAQTAAAKSGLCDGCVLRRISKGSNYFAKAKLEAAGISSKPFVAAGHSDHKH